MLVKRNIFFIHVMIWGLLFSFPLLFAIPPFSVLVRMGIHHIILIALFYLNYYYLIPKYLFSKKKGHYVFWLIFAVFTVPFLNLLIVNLFGVKVGVLKGPFVTPDHVRELAPRIFPIFTAALASSIGVAIRIGSKWLSDEKKRESLGQEKLKTELAFLKNQINPHFFFNSMNTIYALVESNTNLAQSAIHKLSGLMRYVLYESEHGFVPLDKEIDFIKDYLELIRMRLPEQVKINFSLQPIRKSQLVPPLIFLAFIENALKHGLSYQNPAGVDIELKEDRGQLAFKIRNKIMPTIVQEGRREGIGLENVRRRLGLIYPENDYQLKIQTESGYYLVNLKLPLK